LSNAIDHLAKGLLGNEKSARYLKRQGADGVGRINASSIRRTQATARGMPGTCVSSQASAPDYAYGNPDYAYG
ncbi:hypothetical protein, partial [Stutzerimonas nitrititolerans]|uniref:hypothetical protein n=1 Tax=Stutzerimonas nitrititolerans TaxID=2482751 RepID=UPI00289770E9